MILEQLGENIERIAGALERIADALDNNKLSVMTTLPAPTATVSADDAADKPKRAARRTKAQIAAEQASQFRSDSVPTPQPVQDAVTVEVAFVPESDPEPVTQPVAQPVVEEPRQSYGSLGVEEQFNKLSQIVVPNYMHATVRDTLVSVLAAYGLQMPISSPEDRSMPGDAYRATSVAARLDIYNKVAAAVAALPK